MCIYGEELLEWFWPVAACRTLCDAQLAVPQRGVPAEQPVFPQRQVWGLPSSQ